MFRLLLVIILFFCSSANAQTSFRLGQFPNDVFQVGNVSLTTLKHSLRPSELALVVNTQDPQSVQVANYYQTARGIPAANIIQVSFVPSANMGRDEFALLRADVLARTPANVQAYALTWTTPWRVDCMSVTSAFAFGFSTEYCQPNPNLCNTTKFSNYYSTYAKQPRTDVKVMPTIMLAGLDFNKVKAVIDRGVAADLTFPKGDAYLIHTTDLIRSARGSIFADTASVWNDPINSLKVNFIDNSSGFGENNYIQNVNNVLFYFTGLYTVPGINTLSYVPGAIADHLTSYGGALTAGYDQMTALQWLDAGVTGSYGTVVEPCAYTTKFPNPSILFQFYFAGESLIESYWKSVAMPGEGVFVGEPLARPWGTKVSTLQTGEVQIDTTSFFPYRNYYLLKPSAADNTIMDVVQSFATGAQQFQTIKFTPTANQYYLLSDNELVSLNQPPVLNAIGNKSVNENQTISFTISATDPDGDAITYSATGLPSGATFSSNTRTFTWKPSYSQSGTYAVTFVASDGQSSDTESITITVNNVNRAPTINTIGNKTIAENSKLSFTVSGSDPDGNAITFSASNLPSGATFNTSTKVFSWTPNYAQAGTYNNVTFTVSDGSLSSSTSIAITVTNTNRAPLLNGIGNKTVAAAANLSFVVSGSDPDGDAISFAAYNLPSGATFDALTKTFSWTPNAAGTFSNIIFSVSDGKLSASEAISITVNGVNQPPVINPIGNKTVAENSTLSFIVSGSDPEGRPLTFSATNLPAGSNFNTVAQVFSWTPNFNQAGSYNNVSFTASDGSLTASTSITITVTNTNRSPVLNGIGNKSVDVGSNLNFIISGSDPDGDIVTYTASNLPSGATFDVNTRTLNWTPNVAGTYGNVVFNISDGQLTASETITIYVTAVNQPPTINTIGNKTVEENSNLSFTVSGSDPDGNALTYSASNLPSGSSFNPVTQIFTWTPGYTQAGTYNNVVFTVSDGSLTASTSITIIVTNTNRAPILNTIGKKITTIGSLLSFSVSGTDPDGDSLTFFASNLPSGATFNASTKVFSWAPTVTGTFNNINFLVTDGSLNSSENISITVNPAVTNTPPVLTPIGGRIATYGQTLSITIVASDVNGDALTYKAYNLPSGASFNALTKQFLFTPAFSQVGSSYLIRFTVTDGKSAEVFEDVSIRVVGKKAVILDYTGDKRSDNSLFRSINAIFTSYVGNGYVQNLNLFGNSNAKPVHGDFDGDGVVDRAVVLPGDLIYGPIAPGASGTNMKWLIRYSSNSTIVQKDWGTTADLALTGDLNGDKRDEIIYFRNGSWVVQNENGTSVTYIFGVAGDLPRVQDFDGDGFEDMAIYRPSNGTWYISLYKKDANGNRTLISRQFGNSTDIPMPADYDNDGVADLAFWRPSNGTWYVFNLVKNVSTSTWWGSSGDVPVVGDFNSDGTIDYTIYRSTTKKWYHNLRNGNSSSLNFGETGDLVVRDY